MNQMKLGSKRRLFSKAKIMHDVILDSMTILIADDELQTVVPSTKKPRTNGKLYMINTSK